MKTVWFVEQGSYSAYHVVGVYTKKSNAQLVADAVNATEDYDAADIREVELDEGLSEINHGYKPWLIYMLRDGTVEEVTSWEGFYLKTTYFLWDRPNAPAYKGTDTPACLNATVLAKNKKHAVKIANEIRARMIANGEWK